HPILAALEVDAADNVAIAQPEEDNARILSEERKEPRLVDARAGDKIRLASLAAARGVATIGAVHDGGDDLCVRGHGRAEGDTLGIGHGATCDATSFRQKSRWAFPGAARRPGLRL